MNNEFKTTTDVKKQHTVPRFLLDKFGRGKKGKRESCILLTNLINENFNSRCSMQQLETLFTTLKTTQKGQAWSLFLGYMKLRLRH